MIAAPKLQINHKFIDRSVAKWLDLHFGDASFNGRIFIGHRRRGGGVYTMSARSLTDLKQYVMLIHASQRIDYYITANTVCYQCLSAVAFMPKSVNLLTFLLTLS